VLNVSGIAGVVGKRYITNRLVEKVDEVVGFLEDFPFWRKFIPSPLVHLVCVCKVRNERPGKIYVHENSVERGDVGACFYTSKQQQHNPKKNLVVRVFVLRIRSSLTPVSHSTKTWLI
jgi:hypothetical protein